MDEKLDEIRSEVTKHIENGDFTKKDFEMFCARYNNFSDKKAVVRYDRLVALQNNEVIADMYKTSKNKLVEGYEAIKDLSWNELSDAVLSEAGKKSTRCTLQAEPLEGKRLVLGCTPKQLSLF